MHVLLGLKIHQDCVCFKWKVFWLKLMRRNCSADSIPSIKHLPIRCLMGMESLQKSSLWGWQIKVKAHLLCTWKYLFHNYIWTAFISIGSVYIYSLCLAIYSICLRKIICSCKMFDFVKFYPCTHIVSEIHPPILIDFHYPY